MGRRKGGLTELLDLAVRLPWKVSAALVPATFLILLAIEMASAQSGAVTDMKQMGSVVIRGYIHTFAYSGKYIAPLVFAIGAADADSRLYVRVSLATRPGELVERRLRVDTGSEDSIDDDTVRNSPNTKRTTLGNGLGTSYEDVSGVYDTVIIGPYTFRQVWGPAGAVPIVGMEMMRRFTLTFDTKSGLLYLEPNSSLNEPVLAPS
jgi:hypothetical protein